MTAPLLTIIVPTYKRSANLSILLHALREEVASVADDVVVYVSDNCSPDDTPAVIERISADWPALHTYRHASNVGPDNNFCHCVQSVRSRWFWIIGDDDLPKRGIVVKLLSLLRQRQPALLYMQSEWMNPVLSPDQGIPVGPLRVAELDAQTFAESVHVWTTYISAVVIDCERLAAALQGQSINRFNATNLVQLGWVLPLLKTTGPFLFVLDRCILATKDNSGGYGLLTVFGVNFARIVNDSFGTESPLSRKLIDANVRHYLPGLIWSGRSATCGSSHAMENPWPEMNYQLGSRWLYWLLLVPLGRFPRFFAHPLFQTWRVCNRLQREWKQRFSIGQL